MWDFRARAPSGVVPLPGGLLLLLYDPPPPSGVVVDADPESHHDLAEGLGSGIRSPLLLQGGEDGGREELEDPAPPVGIRGEKPSLT